MYKKYGHLLNIPRYMNVVKERISFTAFFFFLDYAERVFYFILTPDIYKLTY